MALLDVGHTSLPVLRPPPVCQGALRASAALGRLPEPRLRTRELCRRVFLIHFGALRF